MVTGSRDISAEPRPVGGRLRRLLDRLDRWVERHEQYRPIGAGGYILRMRVAPYRGKRLALLDGTIVERGDLIGELHLDNRFAAALHAEGHGGFRFRHELLRFLPALDLDLRTRPEYRAVNAVCAASVLLRFAYRAGFEHRPLPPFTQWWLGTWERILLASYHPDGWRRLGKGRRMELQQYWVTRRTLARFLERGPAVRHAPPAPSAGERSGETE